MLLYINSEWFRNLGHDFYSLKFNLNMIKSNLEFRNVIYDLISKVLLNELGDIEDYMNKIVSILVDEAKISALKYNDYLTYNNNNKMLEIIKYINRYIQENLTIEDVADELYMSQSNVSRIFNKTMGIGAKNYIDGTKVAYTMKCVTSSKKTISTISLEYGYSSVSQFTKKFKELIGCAPQRYRKFGKYDKSLNIVYEETVPEEKREYAFILKERMASLKSEEENVIDIRKVKFERRAPIFTIIQMHSEYDMENFLQALKNNSPNVDLNNIILHSFISLQSFRTLESQKVLEDFLFKAYKNDINVSFEVNDYSDYDIIKNVFLNIINRIKLDYKRMMETSRTNIYFSYNLQTIDLKSVYSMDLKVKYIFPESKICIDISRMLNDKTYRKNKRELLSKLKSDLYFIDNNKLDMPYLEENYTSKLIKETFEFEPIKLILRELNIHRGETVLLNVKNKHLLNDPNKEIVNTSPLLLYIFKKIRIVFRGIGIDLFKQSNRDETTLYLFESEQFKSMLYFFVNMGLELGEHWISFDCKLITLRQENQVTVFIYDEGVVENEAYNDTINNKVSDVKIIFGDEEEEGAHLIVTEAVDDVYGNIDDIIPLDIRSRYNISTQYLKEINLRTNTQLKIYETVSNVFNVKLTANSSKVVRIYNQFNI